MDIQVVINDIPKHWRAWALIIGLVLILIGRTSSDVPLQWFGGIIMILGVVPKDLLEKIYEDIRRA